MHYFLPIFYQRKLLEREPVQFSWKMPRIALQFLPALHGNLQIISLYIDEKWCRQCDIFSKVLHNILEIVFEYISF